MFMAACGAMNLKIGALATIVALLLVACSNGRAVISAPRPGSPIQWAACKAAEFDSTRAQVGAECGTLSVTIDYEKPGGDVGLFSFGTTVRHRLCAPIRVGEGAADSRHILHSTHANVWAARMISARETRPTW